MKVKINTWQAIATWVWDIEKLDKCTICQLPFESPCPKCKVPGDECPPGKYQIVQGICEHHFHLHCIIRWTQEGQDQCPLDRQKWVVKKD